MFDVGTLVMDEVGLTYTVLTVKPSKNIVLIQNADGETRWTDADRLTAVDDYLLATSVTSDDAPGNPPEIAPVKHTVATPVRKPAKKVSK